MKWLLGISIFAYGLSALPGIGLYARKVSSLPAATPEHQMREDELDEKASGCGRLRSTYGVYRGESSRVADPI
jgi:hypothetical protein